MIKLTCPKQNVWLYIAPSSKPIPSIKVSIWVDGNSIVLVAQINKKSFSSTFSLSTLNLWKNLVDSTLQSISRIQPLLTTSPDTELVWVSLIFYLNHCRCLLPVLPMSITSLFSSFLVQRSFIKTWLSTLTHSKIWNSYNGFQGPCNLVLLRANLQLLSPLVTKHLCSFQSNAS
jgi:hypothetical protein